MYIGTMKVYLILRQSRSLKDKRQVVSSIKEKLQQSFNISIAEVDLLDDRQQAVLGIAMVSNEMGHLQAALQKILDALRSHPVAELGRHESHVEAAILGE
ncbi:MAG TPA: DUF503 domain-containing protein [Gemmatales bacterium]|nr:DUF503 domain-containing protein [Gemmatales bacterium]